MTNQPSQLRTAIHNYFREFGYETCEAIYTELVRAGSLGGLLKRLGLEDPGQSDDQYAYVLNFIRRNGVQKFMESLGRAPMDYKVQPRMSGDEVRKFEDEKGAEVRDAAIRQAQQTRNAAGTGQGGFTPERVRMKMPTLTDRPGSGTKTPASGDRNSSSRAPKMDSGSAAPPSKSEATPSKTESSQGALAAKRSTNTPKPTGKTPEAGNPPGTLPDGTWDGVTERRSGRDRRSGDDRRQAIELVFKNRRFGGDRRSAKERRRNWPPKVWPPDHTKPPK